MVAGVKAILSAILAAFSLILAACAPETPATRIQTNPGKYAVLSDHHKDLVRQGQIDRGMSGDAVYLAWGQPSRVYEGAANGTTTTRWDYARLQPIYTSSFYGGYAWGHYGYPYGRGRYDYPYYAVAPQVSYVPYHAASVLFKRGKVDSWERIR
jgi:hypothetical protein